MKKIKFTTILLTSLLFANPAGAAVVFEESFNDDVDWARQQPTGSAQSCYPPTYCDTPGSISVPDKWTGWYTDASFCHEISGFPGVNDIYVAPYAGYPKETNPCYGVSGKCETVWLESGKGAADGDGALWKDLGTEYEEIFLRWKIRFKQGYELRALQGNPPTDGSITKLFRIYHYLDGSPYSFWQGNTGNQPVAAGGLGQYMDTIQFYTEGRCQNEYICHSVMVWNLGTVSWAYAPGGIYDGNWHTIELRIKRNSAIGLADGLFEVWYDGVKKDAHPDYPNTNIPWNDAGSTEMRGWRSILMNGNTNNQWDTRCDDAANPEDRPVGFNMDDCEQWYAMDDIVVSTTYIGPDYVIGGGPPPDTTSPNAPGGLTVR